MTHAVAFAMFGWIPIVLALFMWLPPWRAALVAFLVGWMFLPIAEYTIKGFPDYTKLSATCGVVLIAIAIFDFRRLISLRPIWFDVPVLLFCLSPSVSSFTNGLGLHEALAVVFQQAMTWGVPYTIGRLYFYDLSRLRELAIGIVVCGVVYAPLCLFEIWKGPELHKLVYGYYQPYVDTEPRFGILRPMVFMQGGLALALWMAATTTVGFWLWRTRAFSPNWRATLACLLPVLGLTTILIRSVNGWILLALGVGLLSLCFIGTGRAYIVCVIVLLISYIGIRAAGLWSGRQAVTAVDLVLPVKHNSIFFRFRNEDVISANARERPIFGWGRRAAALQDGQGSYAISDTLWAGMFAEFGTVGLIGLTGALLLPVVLFISYFPPAQWKDASVAPAAALAITLVLYTIDNLANAMNNPVFMLIAGGLVALSANASRTSKRHPHLHAVAYS